MSPDGDWEWGGCADNVQHGYKKSREFMDAKYRKRSDLKTQVMLHNNEAGRLVKFFIFTCSSMKKKKKKKKKTCFTFLLLFFFLAGNWFVAMNFERKQKPPSFCLWEKKGGQELYAD